MLLSPSGTKYRESVAPDGAGADFDNAKAWFRMPDQDEWVAKMTANPDVFVAILSDIFRETRAERERRAGRAKIGRRPNAIDGSLDELWDMITPKYSMEPFPAALHELIGGMSMSAFSRLVGLPRRTIEHMTTGAVRPEMWRLARIARACEVSPAYFREYRESFVLTVVAELLRTHPNLSITFGRAFTRPGRR